MLHSLPARSPLGALAAPLVAGQRRGGSCRPPVRGAVTCAAASAGKAKPGAAPASSEDEYFTTPSGRRYKKPQNAFEQYLFDFYNLGGVQKPLSGFELEMKRITDENFGEGVRNWAVAVRALRAGKTGACSVEKAAQLIASRRAPGPLDAILPQPVLLDVREPEKFSQRHAKGAVGVPLYTRMTQPVTPFDWFRTVSFAVIGFKPPMRNRAFVDEVAALVKGNKRTPLLVICAYGGTLESATDRKKRNPRLPAPIFGEFGASSQSLLAMYALQQAGFTNLTHVEGGFSSYTSARLPMDNDDE